MHLPTPQRTCLRLLRKRKKDTDNTTNDNSKNDDQSSEKLATPVKRTQEEDEISRENVMKNMVHTAGNDTQKDHSFKDTNYTNNVTDTDMIKQNNTDFKSLNDKQNSFISVRKIEDLCKTPKKNNISDKLDNNGSIKKENMNSLNIFSSFVPTISSMDWNSQNIQALLETPVSHKRGKYEFNNSTPNRRKRRKSSLNISDIDVMSDIFKSELCDNALTDKETIDMLHDVNSIINFEEIELSADILTSTVNNTMHNKNNVEMSKDPLTDPIFIANNDEHSITIKNGKYKSNKTRVKKTQTRRNQVKERKLNAEHNPESTRDSKVNNTETIDYLKDVLGDLDIESEPETKETFKYDLQKVYNLEVKLTHDVPPQHKIEQRSGTKALTKAEKQLFLQYGPIKNGVFSPNEDEIILNNWKTFCEIHEWNPKHVKPFIRMKYGTKFYIKSKEQRMKFVQFLANGLPWRSLYSVYRRFRYLHENHKRSFTRYTLFEDQKILSYMKKNNEQNKTYKKFAELAEMLGRTNHSIWLRYQTLKKMQEHTQEEPASEVAWTLPLIAKFIRTLMDVTLCDSVQDLKNAIIPKVIWSKLEKKLNIQENVLKLFWIHQLHMQLFCPERIYLNDIKIKLIEYVYGKGFTHTRQIIWPNVAKYFDGITTVFLCKTFYNLVTEASIKMGSRNFIEIIEYLYKEKIPEIQNEPTDKFLPRLSYKNKKIKIVDDDQYEDFDFMD